jgi:hypothetical protein
MKEQFSHNFHQQIVGWEVCDGHLILMALQLLLLMLALIISNEILYNLKWKELSRQKVDIANYFFFQEHWAKN